MTIKSINPTTNISDVIVHLKALPVDKQQEVFAYIDFLRCSQHSQTADFTAVLKKTVPAERVLNTSQQTILYPQEDIKKTTKKNICTGVDHIFDDNEISIDTNFIEPNNDMQEDSADNLVKIDLPIKGSIQPSPNRFASMAMAYVEVKKPQKNNVKNFKKSSYNRPVNQDATQKLHKLLLSKTPVTIPQVRKRKAKKRFLAWSSENERPLKGLDAIWQGLVDNATAHTTKFNPHFEVWYQKNQRALQLMDQNWAENNAGRQLSPVEHQQIFQQLYEKWGDNWKKQHSNQLSMQAVKNRFYDWRAENEQNLVEHRANMLLTNTDHELEIQRLYDELEYTDDVGLSKELLEKIDAKNRFLIWREQHD